VLTLYTTPVIYIFFDNLGGWFSRRGSKTAHGGPDGGPEIEGNHEAAEA
jgi:hypothetical protein